MSCSENFQIVACNNYDGFQNPHIFLKIHFSILKII
jgi:hypothetical protein